MEQKASNTAQLSGRQVLCQEPCVKSAKNGNHDIAKLQNYLKTPGGLFRLLALFPAKMAVEEAIRQSAAVLTWKGGSLC